MNFEYREKCKYDLNVLNGVEDSSMWLSVRVSNKYIFKHPFYATALNYTFLQLLQSVNVCNH